jgi:BolA family transcriptional regulator, general stress-responsive regulator
MTTAAAVAASKGAYYTRIVRKLTDALNPTRLVLVDESHKHAGHREAPGLPETHFRLEVASSAFDGVRLLERQRRVYDILQDEMRERVHALSMSTSTPSEDLAAGRI